MATRFYLINVGTTGALPTVNSSWEQGFSSSTQRSVLSPVRQNSPFLTLAVDEASASTTFDVFVAQFISPPIAAISISGTVKGIIRAREFTADADMRAQLGIYVFNSDLSVLRGTLLAHDAGALASEFATTLTNRKFPLAWGAPVALTPVAALTNDRIVIEVGYRAHNATGSTKTGALEYGDNSATDLAENETDVLQNNPWFEFSDTFVFPGLASGRRGASTSLITQLGQKGRPPVQARGESYEHEAPANSPASFDSQLRGSPREEAENSPSDIAYRSRPGSFLASEDEIVDGQGDFPGKLPIRHFTMKAYNTTLTQYVTWTSPRVPDFVGDLSGYPIIQLTNIAIVGSYKEFFH